MHGRQNKDRKKLASPSFSFLRSYLRSHLLSARWGLNHRDPSWTTDWTVNGITFTTNGRTALYFLLEASSIGWKYTWQNKIENSILTIKGIWISGNRWHRSPDFWTKNQVFRCVRREKLILPTLCKISSKKKNIMMGSRRHLDFDSFFTNDILISRPVICSGQ